MRKILFDFLVWIYKRKFIIITSEILVLIFAFVYALFIAIPQYSSSVSFFLPNTSRSNPILGLAGLSGVNVNTGSNIDPSQIEILFNTTNYKKNFIEHMGLIERYELEGNANPLFNTIRRLNKNLLFEVIEKGSIATTEPISYTITYFDTDPDSAFIGVKYLYALLDSSIRDISVSRAFLEQGYFRENIEKTSLKLDTLKVNFLLFQQENNLFSINAQRDATINVYSQLMTTKIQHTITHRELSEKFGSRSRPAIEVRNKISAIEKVMKTLPMDTNSILLQSLSDMNYYKYLEFVRDIEFYTNFNLFLRNQYEQAYLRINNDLTSLQLIDEAIRPVYKSRPKRAMIIVVIMFVYNFVLFSVLASYFGYGIIKKRGYFDAFFKAL